MKKLSTNNKSLLKGLFLSFVIVILILAAYLLVDLTNNVALALGGFNDPGGGVSWWDVPGEEPGEFGYEAVCGDARVTISESYIEECDTGLCRCSKVEEVNSQFIETGSKIPCNCAGANTCPAGESCVFPQLCQTGVYYGEKAADCNVVNLAGIDRCVLEPIDGAPCVPGEVCGDGEINGAFGAEECDLSHVIRKVLTLTDCQIEGVNGQTYTGKQFKNRCTNDPYYDYYADYDPSKCKLSYSCYVCGDGHLIPELEVCDPGCTGEYETDICKAIKEEIVQGGAGKIVSLCNSYCEWQQSSLVDVGDMCEIDENNIIHCNVCVPGCPSASTINCGQTQTLDDGCGGTCNITGTKCDFGTCVSGQCVCTPICPTASQVPCGTTDTRANSCGGNCNITGTYCEYGSCVAGSCSCTPICPTPSQVPCGTTDTRANQCGGNCNVVGTQCATGICESGTCVSACTNECSVSGAKQCSGNILQTCGNYDADICLEWGNNVDCTASGQVCQSNACVAAGGEDEPCLPGDVCDTGLACQSGVCISPAICSDGTAINTCSATKPQYCNASTQLVNNCSQCGCSSGYVCQADGGCLQASCTADTWATGGEVGTATTRYNFSAVWTGSKMIVWGGIYGTYTNRGDIYDPTVNIWSSISTTNAPTARILHTAVWTGSKMIVWGGYTGATYLNTGGIYDSTTNTWTATNTTNAPIARFNHFAFWTGTKMIVWGGQISGTDTNTGGTYDPAADTWLSISTTNTPSLRNSPMVVWAGSRMIVWGGFGTGYLNTGAVYDLNTNTWTATSTTNAPSGRGSSVAVWTGSKMIVWGGYNGSTVLNTGGIYDPATNTWTATNTTNAPAARMNATAVWTGSKMIVWGGYEGTAYLNTGGIYDPATNAWTTLSIIGAPSARYNHKAVWTGADMIIFGGSNINDNKPYLYHHICGAVPAACSNGQILSTCICAGQSRTSGWCCNDVYYSSTPNDDNNCGGCGNTCQTGYACVNGACQFAVSEILIKGKTNASGLDTYIIPHLLIDSNENDGYIDYDISKFNTSLVIDGQTIVVYQRIYNAATSSFDVKFILSALLADHNYTLMLENPQGYSMAAHISELSVNGLVFVSGNGIPVSTPKGKYCVLKFTSNINSGIAYYPDWNGCTLEDQSDSGINLICADISVVNCVNNSNGDALKNKKALMLDSGDFLLTGSSTETSTRITKYNKDGKYLGVAVTNNNIGTVYKYSNNIKPASFLFLESAGYLCEYSVSDGTLLNRVYIAPVNSIVKNNYVTTLNNGKIVLALKNPSNGYLNLYIGSITDFQTGAISAIVPNISGSSFSVYKNIEAYTYADGNFVISFLSNLRNRYVIEFNPSGVIQRNKLVTITYDSLSSEIDFLPSKEFVLFFDNGAVSRLLQRYNSSWNLESEVSSPSFIDSVSGTTDDNLNDIAFVDDGNIFISWADQYSPFDYTNLKNKFGKFNQVFAWQWGKTLQPNYPANESGIYGYFTNGRQCNLFAGRGRVIALFPMVYCYSESYCPYCPDLGSTCHNYCYRVYDLDGNILCGY